MAGKGKYTKYAPEPTTTFSEPGTGNSPQYLGRSDLPLLKRLFAVPDVVPATNNQADIDNSVLKISNQYLSPRLQEGDPDFFPNGVYLDFNATNPDPATSAPDIPNINVTQGDYARAGGPSSPYTPNLVSPDPSGAGSIEPTVAQEIKFSQAELIDYKNNKVTPGQTEDTLSPKSTADKMYSGNQLPSDLKIGQRPGGNI
jgi:hypothetical protein